jgi:uncharacterized surface protein with fasciclin (FAS1) repeats
VQTRPGLTELNEAITLADANKNVTGPFFVDILSQPSPELTLFAPNDRAFFLAQTDPLYRLYTTFNYSFHLFNLLASHIVTPAFSTAVFPLEDLPNLAQTTTDVLRLPDTTGDFFVNSTNSDRADIVNSDIAATNGIAHIVDAVALPDFTIRNPLQAIQNLGPDFSIFRSLIAAANFEQVYARTSNSTLLVVPNAGISQDTVDFLLRPGNEGNLTAVLRYLVVPYLYNFATVSPIPDIIILDTTLPGPRNQILSAVLRTNNSLPLPQPLTVSFGRARATSTFLTRDSFGYVLDQMIFPPPLTNVTPASAESVGEIPLQR